MKDQSGRSALQRLSFDPKLLARLGIDRNLQDLLVRLAEHRETEADKSSLVEFMRRAVVNKRFSIKRVSNSQAEMDRNFWLRNVAGYLLGIYGGDFGEQVPSECRTGIKAFAVEFEKRWASFHDSGMWQHHGDKGLDFDKLVNDLGFSRLNASFYEATLIYKGVLEERMLRDIVRAEFETAKWIEQTEKQKNLQIERAAQSARLRQQYGIVSADQVGGSAREIVSCLDFPPP